MVQKKKKKKKRAIKYVAERVCIGTLFVLYCELCLLGSMEIVNFELCSM